MASLVVPCELWASANICDLDFYPEYSNIGKLWPESWAASIKTIGFYHQAEGKFSFLLSKFSFQILVSSYR